MLLNRLFAISPSGYQMFDRVRRRGRPLYESERKKHLRERREADYLLISLTNCGRTWLRVILGKAMQLQYDSSGCLKDINLHDLYSFSERLPTLPAIKPMHEKFGQWNHTYEGQKVILLVRDPRDAVVSRYHQHKDEMGYESLERYVRESNDLTDYVRFYNDWQTYSDRPKAFHPIAFMRIRYEDMKADTFAEMQRVFEFLDLAISEDNIRSAIDYASFKNMRKMEITGEGQIRTDVMSDRSLSDPSSFKVRKGSIGGYASELSPELIAFVDETVATQLDPDYGYGLSV